MATKTWRGLQPDRRRSSKSCCCHGVCAGEGRTTGGEDGRWGNPFTPVPLGQSRSKEFEVNGRVGINKRWATDDT